MKELITFDVSSCGVGEELTFANVAELANRGLDFSSKDIVEINLKTVSHVDSAGLALLVEWMKQANRDGFNLQFTGMSERLARLVHIAGLEFMVADSHEQHLP